MGGGDGAEFGVVLGGEVREGFGAFAPDDVGRFAAICFSDAISGKAGAGGPGLLVMAIAQGRVLFAGVDSVR